MFSQGNEILTLSFGHYSAYIATHFFNIQEASFSYNPNFSTGINHEALFRESAHRSNLFSPRLILVDDEDSLGFLSKEGYFKEINEPVPKGSSDLAVIAKETPWERNNFLSDYFCEKQRLKTDPGPCTDYLLKSSYSLDDSVSSWSDYLITEFDNKTIITLPRSTEHYENYENFSHFDSGLSLWEKTNLSEEVEENIRFFLEECDYLQGFQVITDGGNGYSGISSGCAEYLNDEFSKKARIVVPVIYVDLSKDEDVRTQIRKKFERVYSLASSFSSYSEFCNITAPMSHMLDPWSKDPSMRTFRSIHYKHDLMYHTSSILASALDLLTLPCRLQTMPNTMNTLCSSLNIYGRSFATVGLNMPFPAKRNDKNLPQWDQVGGRFFESLTPMIDVNPDFVDIQSISTKGLGRNYLPSSNLDDSRLKIIEDDFKIYLQRLFPRVVTQISTCKSAFRVPRTYPNVMDIDYNLSNAVHEYGPLSEYITVGGLHNSREMFNVLNNLYEETKTARKKSITGFRPKDSDVDYDQLFENLKTSIESYNEFSFL